MEQGIGQKLRQAPLNRNQRRTMDKLVRKVKASDLNANSRQLLRLTLQHALFLETTLRELNVEAWELAEQLDHERGENAAVAKLAESYPDPRD